MSELRSGARSARQVCVLGSAEPGSAAAVAGPMGSSETQWQNSPILSWSSLDELRKNLETLGLLSAQR